MLSPAIMAARVHATLIAATTASGLTQDAIALRLGVSREQFNRVANGRACLTLFARAQASAFRPEIASSSREAFAAARYIGG